METLKVTFVKRKDDDNIYKPAYFNSRAHFVINPNDFLPSLQLSQHTLGERDKQVCGFFV